MGQRAPLRVSSEAWPVETRVNPGGGDKVLGEEGVLDDGERETDRQTDRQTETEKGSELTLHAQCLESGTFVYLLSALNIHYAMEQIDTLGWKYPTICSIFSLIKSIFNSCTTIYL